jgi:hypothetical protein
MIRKHIYLLGFVILLFLTECVVKKNEITTEARSDGWATPLPATKAPTAADLNCRDYVEARWGSDSTEWGFPDGRHGSRRTELLPLRFDMIGRLYFFDFANERLLRFDGKNTLPDVISLKPFLSMEDPPPFSYSIAIQQNKIIVPYYSDQLVILSISGDVVGSIKLPFSYDVFLPARSVVEIDPQGRLCTFKGTYDIGWADGIWKKVNGGCMDSYFWENYIVSGSTSVAESEIVLDLYDIKLETSRLVYTDLPNVYLLSSISLFGVDHLGNAYLDTGHMTYARYSLVTGQTQLGNLKLDTNYTVAIPSVSPDGTLYILAYSDKDLSVHPRILACEFPG